jgi:23S rRNA (pseudouridine1915-N3)-methyltransferase
MKLLIVAVGQRIHDWAQTAWDDYAKRFPPELKVELKAVKTEPRGSKTYETLVAAERLRIEADSAGNAHCGVRRTRRIFTDDGTGAAIERLAIER